VFAKSLVAWVSWVTRHAMLALVLLAVATALLSWVAVTQFRMNSDLSKLITQETDWRVDFDRFEASFPQLVRTAVVVVSGESLKKVEIATARVVDYLEAHPEYFTSVAAPGSEAFFRDHALLYMDFDELDDLTDRLAEAQPWLTAVAEDPSMRGVMRLVADGLENDAPAGFAKVLDLLADSAARILANTDGTIWWSDELFATEGTRYQLVSLQASVASGEVVTDAQVVNQLRTMVAALEIPQGVQLRLTGELTLQREEIEAALKGVSMAGWAALVLLLLVLVVGVRSGKIIVATFTMLAIGIIWTSAYAMLTVGEYNTLSLIFLVMFFGLGVDFALHFSLRFQEAVNRGVADVENALVTSTRSVGRAISLCTLTTALGFLGFWPTDYQGLADLGVISAGGMAIAWFLTFTFLPAFYALAGAPRAHEMEMPTSELIIHWLIRHRPVVISVVLLSGVVAAFGASKASFDYSVLALKDPQSESMRTLRTLQDEGLSTDYQLVVVSEQPLDEQALQHLAVVDEVRIPADLVPTEQVDKRYTIDDLQQMLWSALEPKQLKPSPLPDALRAQGRDVLSSLDAALLASSSATSVPVATLDNFRSQLMAMLASDDETLLSWQTAVITNLQDELAWLRRATAVEEVTFEQLPASMRDRLVTDTGEQLSVILPAQDITAVNDLSEFITDVRELVPNATGRPVIEWGVGRIVVKAFKEALVVAVVSITLVLILALRRSVLVALILLPLVLTVLFCLALGVVFDQSINMANILVLPLIFGLGVDNGIHVVDRYLGEGDVDHLLHSSTPRAVLLSTLTTIGTFLALSLSPHAGTASIGILLTIAIGFLLLFTIFLLPVLLSASKRTI